MFKKTLISLGIIALAFVALFAGNSTLHIVKAAGPTTGSPFQQKTYPSYVVHGIPGIPVDVYVNGKLTIPNFQPGTTVGPLNLTPGYYTVALYTPGADPNTATPIVKTPIPVQSNIAPVTIIARLGTNGKPAIERIVESTDFADFPNSGMLVARDDSTNVSSPASFICITALGSFPFLNFSQYLFAGQYKVSFVPYGATSCAHPLASAVVTVQEEINLNVYLVGDQKSNTLQIITESIADEGSNFP